MYCQGEMHVVEFGCNEICGIFPSAALNPYSISLAMNDNVKRLAFLIDPRTIKVHDLAGDTDLESVEHNRSIDWLVRCRFEKVNY